MFEPPADPLGSRILPCFLKHDASAMTDDGGEKKGLLCVFTP